MDNTGSIETEHPARRSGGLDIDGDLFRALFEAAPDAMFIIDERGYILRANLCAHVMCRWPAGTLSGQCVDVLVPVARRRAHRRYRTQFARRPSARGMGVDQKLLALRADGSEFPVDISLSPIEWHGRNLVIAAMRDVTERRGIEQTLLRTLHERAIRDPLTGLFNRRMLDEAMDLEIARARRRRGAVAVIMADIDRFKQVNDTYGHPCGDRVLKQLAEVLQKHMRAGDLVCRYGGEEFVIVLPGCSAEAAYERAELLRSALRQTVWSSADCPVESLALSFGIAAFPVNGTTPDQLIASADAALLRAKAAGRDRVVMSEAPPSDVLNAAAAN